MNFIEFLKRIGKDISAFGKKIFAEDQFVEYDDREALKEEVVLSGMSTLEGSELVQQLDKSKMSGSILNERIDTDVVITPADREGLTQDQTVENIRDGVKTSGKYDERERKPRENGGKERTK